MPNIRVGGGEPLKCRGMSECASDGDANVILWEAGLIDLSACMQLTGLDCAFYEVAVVCVIRRGGQANFSRKGRKASLLRFMT